MSFNKFSKAPAAAPKAKTPETESAVKPANKTDAPSASKKDQTGPKI